MSWLIGMQLPASLSMRRILPALSYPSLPQDNDDLIERLEGAEVEAEIREPPQRE